MIDQPKADFNISAQKIIKNSEFKAKVKALYKTELSFREKIVLRAVEKPCSFFRGIKVGIKLGINEDLQWLFRKAAGDGTQGFYKNILSGGTYFNTGVLPLMNQMDKKRKLTPHLTEKTWELGLKAAEQCQDYSELRSRGILVPRLK